MKKNLISMFMDKFKMMERNINTLKNSIPEIIEGYKTYKSKTAKQEVKIVQNYYKQLITMNEIFNKLNTEISKKMNKLEV